MSAAASLPAFVARDEYYRHVATGYDRIADTYESVEATNRVGRRLRIRIQEILGDAWPSGAKVLDIGCGTGIEAIFLAQRGIRVVATDVSEAMVRRVLAKASALGLTDIEVTRTAAHEIEQLVDTFGRGSFDGAYSHGGVLNMDPDLRTFARGIGALLRSDGRFLCMLVNQTSLFEILFYPAVLRPRKAFRRLGNVVPVPITRLEPHNRYVVPSRFYSPKEFVRFFLTDFRLARLTGLGIVTAPWNLSAQMDRIDPLARATEALDDFLSDKVPFRGWGSVFFAELERR